MPQVKIIFDEGHVTIETCEPNNFVGTYISTEIHRKQLNDAREAESKRIAQDLETKIMIDVLSLMIKKVGNISKLINNTTRVNEVFVMIDEFKKDLERQLNEKSLDKNKTN